MENTLYYCWNGLDTIVCSHRGTIRTEYWYWPNRNDGLIEINRTKPEPHSTDWQPTTREVFEATRAKVIELLRKEGAI